MSTKTKSKSRVMWAEPQDLNNPVEQIHLHDHRRGSHSERVTIIRHSDIEALVERALAAYWPLAHTQSDGIRAALTAAGIPCTKPTKQRRARK